MHNYSNNEKNRETDKMSFNENGTAITRCKSTIFLFGASLSLAFLLIHISAGLIDSIAYTQPPQPQQRLQNGYNSDLRHANASSPVLPLTTPNSSVFNDVFKQTQGSVVQITRSVPQTGIAADPSQENRTGLGSGFVFDQEGHIITNNHVVANAKVVDVTFTNGDRSRANVTAVDPYVDLAVLKIIETENNTLRQEEHLNALQLANSSALQVGDLVIAIGNPYGLAGTMTTGIVSQAGRLVPAPNIGFSIPDVIQTDAAVNPGNSGGPLLDTKGRVVGVTFGGFPGGVNFAIPSNLVQKIVPALIDEGNYTHPYLGFTGATLTSDLAASIANITQNLKGVSVNTIVQAGPADKAGLSGTTIDQYGRKHGGDVIVAVDGDKIREFEQLVSYIEGNKSPGDNVVLSVFRNGSLIDLDVVLEERPLSSPQHNITGQS
ncbi:MAG: S1C family serine protease [Nitrososphaeraceae archaeon]